MAFGLCISPGGAYEILGHLFLHLPSLSIYSPNWVFANICIGLLLD